METGKLGKIRPEIEFFGHKKAQERTKGGAVRSIHFTEGNEGKRRNREIAKAETGKLNPSYRRQRRERR
jgi:hypothetical protein